MDYAECVAIAERVADIVSVSVAEFAMKIVSLAI